MIKVEKENQEYEEKVRKLNASYDNSEQHQRFLQRVRDLKAEVAKSFLSHPHYKEKFKDIDSFQTFSIEELFEEELDQDQFLNELDQLLKSKGLTNWVDRFFTDYSVDRVVEDYIDPSEPWEKFCEETGSKYPEKPVYYNKVFCIKELSLTKL